MRIPYKGAGIALFYSDLSDTYILLGRRSDYPFHNRWSVPGGYCEKSKDKSIQENAFREFKEETSIDFNSLQTKYLNSLKIKYPLFCWTTFAYLCSSKIDNFIPNEFYELKWINIKNIQQYKLRPFTMKEISLFYKDHH